MNLPQTQKRIYENKVNKGFDITNIDMEFCLLYGEVAEAYDAYRKNKNDLGEELADITIYLLGLAEILDINLEDEIENKLLKNEQRTYRDVNGVRIKIDE